MKYPQLNGICAKLIKTGECTGCNKLLNTDFRGLQECKHFKEKEYKQERMKL